MIQGENNCYNYADNIVTDTFAQPGRLAGKPLPLQSFVMDGKGDLADSEEKILKELCNRIGKAAEADGSRPPRQPGLKPWDCASKCEPGYYKEALFTGSMDPPRGADLDKDNSPDKKWFDYHWYRQDKGGNWSHKQGRTPVTNLDSDKKAITDPRVAKRKYDYDYKQFCGCFCRGPNIAKQ